MTNETRRLRIEARRQRRQLEQAERRMAAQERALEDELKALNREIRRAEDAIDAELRAEHWGREPERAPSWRRQR